MQVLQFLTDIEGTPVWPLALPNANPSVFNYTGFNTITLTFYNDIQTTRDPFTGAITNITPVSPVTTGLAGTITIKARPTPDSPWLNIENNTLDISMDDVMLNAEGLITAVNIYPTSIENCAYIFVQLTRSA